MTKFYVQAQQWVDGRMQALRTDRGAVTAEYAGVAMLALFIIGVGAVAINATQDEFNTGWGTLITEFFRRLVGTSTGGVPAGPGTN